MQTKARVEDVVEKLRAEGYRVTPQRLALLNILCSSPEHLSAAQVHARLRAQFPTTSLATVYKTLAVLKEIGEVQEISFGGEADSHYDAAHPTPHPHLICLRCEEILDAEVDASEECAQADRVQALAERAGYRVADYRFDIYGICPACQAQES
jgi:Fur family peroxide stress response transcriptional regulator